MLLCSESLLLLLPRRSRRLDRAAAAAAAAATRGEGEVKEEVAEGDEAVAVGERGPLRRSPLIVAPSSSSPSPSPPLSLLPLLSLLLDCLWRLRLGMCTGTWRSGSPVLMWRSMRLRCATRDSTLPSGALPPSLPRPPTRPSACSCRFSWSWMPWVMCIQTHTHTEGTTSLRTHQTTRTTAHGMPNPCRGFFFIDRSVQPSVC